MLFIFLIYFICFITSIVVISLDLSKGDGIDTNRTYLLS
nr:MAG TPA: hypothetical protein [Caudoviricetes sp.]